MIKLMYNINININENRQYFVSFTAPQMRGKLYINEQQKH